MIVGDGYDFDNIKKLKSDLGVDDTAIMIGFSDNPYPYIKAADFYILSSRYEGFPTILFEAIILKKKIIATDVSGAKEMLENGKLGMVIKNTDDAIYEMMKKALTEEYLFDNCLQNLENFKAPFDLKNSVNSIIKIIDEL
jgi:glycosyltransferase involved in cell wall biosynthesis